MAKKPLEISTRRFESRDEARKFFQEILYRYKIGERVSEADAADLAGLIQRHPEYAEKVGRGIDHFAIQSADHGTRCFRVVRTDGTWARFSFKTCLQG